MSRMYKNAPLVEAVCEVRFGVDSQWDLAIPGLIYERLKDSFPRRQPVRSLQARFMQGPEGVQQELRQIEFLQFADASGSSFIRVGQNILSVHNVGVYPGWPMFSPRIQRAVDAYAGVASPKSIERVGLRFVNKIRIPEAPITLEDYFEFFPHVGKDLPQDLGPFLLGTEFPFPDNGTVVRLQIAGETSPNPSTVSVGLDLDYFNSSPGTVTLHNLTDWLVIAHDRIERIFEASITDRLRAVFDEVKNG